MNYIGAHVSISGGVENAPLNAAAIGATGFAMFTKNQRQWIAPELKAESVAAFQANCAKFHYGKGQILPHDSYLINLGNPDPEKRTKATAAFVHELERCRTLGLDRLNFHPGSHLRLISEDECLTLIADSVRAALREVPDVLAVFENTAGQGSNLGYSFVQLGAMLERVNLPERVGVCVDTCHAWAAGYDLATPEGYEKSTAEFERYIGFKYLKGMHLNDAKGEVNCHLDRHASLGQGQIGWGAFERIVSDPRIDGVPLILETPNPELWPDEIAHLLQVAAQNR